MTSRIFRRTSTIGILIAAVLLTYGVQSAHAGSPPTTYADADGSRACASLTPCFTKIQDAVDHVGAADAHVFVFPGVYNESVNLSNMASSANHVLGNLTLMTVDAAGNPTPATATIHGAAPISTTTLGFPDDITVDGFIIQSTQNDGVYLKTAGAITIRNSTANNPGDGSSSDNTGDDGFDLATTGGKPITIEDSQAEQAHGNLGDGFQLVTTGGATIRNTQASNNVGTQDNVGINIPDSQGDIILDGVRADGNSEQGIYVYTTGKISLSGEANNNGFRGADLFTELGPASASAAASPQQANAAIALSAFTASDNADDGVLAQAAGDVLARDTQANKDKATGLSLLSQGNVEATNVHVADNTKQGIYVEAENQVTINRVSAIDNGNNGSGEAGMKIVGFGSTLAGVSLADSFVHGNFGQGIDLFNLKADGVHSVGSNVICGNSGGGLRNNGTSLVLPAKGNWWGDASGPTSPQNPGGTGDKVNLGGAGTIAYDPWITHVDGTQIASPAGATGTPSTIAFTFADQADTFFLVNGPGDDLNPSVLSVSTDNGVLTSGSETGQSVHGPISNTQLSVTLTPAHAGEAHVTLSGPCGLTKQLTVQVESGFSRGDLDCDHSVGLLDLMRSLRFTAGLSLSDISGCTSALATFDLDCSGTASGLDPLLLLLDLVNVQPAFSVPADCPHVGS
jgi:hypothetical protein